MTGAVGAAILAANPHNIQPWRFAVKDRSIEVYADATSEMRIVDALRREHHVTLGCAAENLTLGLGARGYGARPRVLVSVLGRAAQYSGPGRTNSDYA